MLNEHLTPSPAVSGPLAAQTVTITETDQLDTECGVMVLLQR